MEEMPMEGMEEGTMEGEVMVEETPDDGNLEISETVE